MPILDTSEIPQEARKIKRTAKTGVSRPRVITFKDEKKRIPFYTVNHPVDDADNFFSRRLAPNELWIKSKDIYNELKSGYLLDAYIRQSVDKYAEKLTANAEKVSDLIRSEYADIKRYLVTRLNLMSEAQDTPFVVLITDASRMLVRDGVVYLVKAFANGKVTVPGFSLSGINGRSIIGGYFIIEASKISPVIDTNTGEVKSWVYIEKLENKTVFKVFPLDHIYQISYCPEGIYKMGTSQILPALDDIRSLRNTEEAVLKLIYRHLNPLIHIKTPDLNGDDLGNQDQIDLISSTISQMTHDGFMVTGPGIEMKAVGAESQALRAESYLNFFKQRGLSGLGMSAVLMGEGSHVNVAGVSALSAQMYDRAKFYQKMLGMFLTQYLVRDLLLEAGYDPFDPETGEYVATFTFPDFDDDEVRKRENHYTDLFTKDIITREEARGYLGKKALSIEQEEDTQGVIKGKIALKYGVKDTTSGTTPGKDNKSKGS